jgi:hypothetical protein
MIWGVPLPGGGRDFKDIENRNNPPPGSYKGRLYIHAGMETDREAPDWSWPGDIGGADLPHGVIIGYVTLVAWTRWAPSRWADPTGWQWWVRNPVKIQPIKARGRITPLLWTPTRHENDLSRQINAAVPVT